MKKDRLYGIDVARIFAMFLVLLFHAQGVLSGFGGSGFTGKVLNAASIACVDLFALISGYVGVTSRFRWSRIASLWIQTVFTGFVVVAVGTAAGIFAPSMKDWGKVFMPISSHAYWYLTEYFLMFLFTPFLNAGFSMLSKRQIIVLAAVMFVGIVAVPSMNPCGSDTYLLGNGLSAMWLIICYFFGGAIRTVDNGFGGVGFWSGISVAMVAASFYKGGGYSHPLIIATAACYLVACSRIDIGSKRLQRAIVYFSSCAFGVYLWHGQPMLHDAMKGCFSFVWSHPPYVVIPEMIAISVAMYLVISFLEFLRMKLFALCRVGEALKRIFAER